PQSRSFSTGVLTISALQAPSPSALSGACEDRSAEAGAGTAPGSRTSWRGVCTAQFGNIFYMQDQSDSTRTGVALFAPIVNLTLGHSYLVAAAIQEFANETQGTSNVYVRDEGSSTIPSATLQTPSILRDS